MITEGTIINERYRVLNLLGEGGMGAVYAGEHTGVGRRVAIKVLHPEYMRHPEVVERFEREAKAAAAIGHDHIIDVLDFGRHEGLPYMVMEFLKGESLDSRLNDYRSGMPVELACSIMGQTLAALGAAHAAGIVHRDMKPDNVFLVSKGGKDFVKVIDFGISKFGAGEGAAPMGRSLTKTGALMGTPAYMAPEQALAKRDADHRVDVYAAGVLLYEMLTGFLPFDAESETELLLAIVHRPEGLKPPHALNPSVPTELSAVVMKAMALDRKDRYESANAFQEALVQFGGPGVEAHEVPTPSRTSGILAVPEKPKTPTSMGWERRSQAGMGSGPVATGEMPVGAKRSKPSTTLIAGGAVLALLAAGGIFAVVRAGATPGSASTAAAARGSSSASAAPSVSPTVQIDLEGLPAGAEVQLDGARVEGSVLRLDRGTTHSVRVSAQGKTPFETRLVADRDRSLAVALADLPSAAPAPSGSGAPAAVAANSGAGAAPAGRPAGRSGESSMGSAFEAAARTAAVAAAANQAMLANQGALSAQENRLAAERAAERAAAERAATERALQARRRPPTVGPNLEVDTHF